MNLGNLYAGALGAVSTASDLILVSTDQTYGIKSMGVVEETFLFHIIGEQAVNAQSDITDHYVENNTALQDHIAIRPTNVTVSGYIGELNNVVPKALLPLKQAVDRLGILDGYLPAITNTALRAYNTASQAYAAAQKASSAYKKITGAGVEQTKQQVAYAYFYNRFLNRQLFQVQTPYGMFDSMAIQSLRVTQTEGDKNQSDFEITFKKIKMAQTLLTSKKTLARGANPIKNLGSSTPV